jgi:large subunit ribosomal protein L15
VKLHELSPAKGSRKTRQRVGRGHGAGQGKTSGRGQKGQGSRSSVGLPAGFEGGQMPLKQRLPKLRGFHNRWRHEFVVVNLGKLARFDKDSVVDADVLTEAGLIPRASSPIKVLAAGHLGHALTLRVDRISGAARTAVEAAGGTVELVGPQPQEESVTRGKAAARATKHAAKIEAAEARAAAGPAEQTKGKRAAKGEKAQAAPTEATADAAATRTAATEAAKPTATEAIAAERPARRSRKAPAAEVSAPDPDVDGAPDNEAETEDSE